MLPSLQRLSRAEITTFLANPAIKVVFNRLGTLKFHLGETGFTVVTGSKHQKKAVLRNKIRRQIYSVVSQYNKDVSFTGMLYVSKNAYEMPFNDIKQHVYSLLEKITHENK